MNGKYNDLKNQPGIIIKLNIAKERRLYVTGRVACKQMVPRDEKQSIKRERRKGKEFN